jgi:hypothetical protein
MKTSPLISAFAMLILLCGCGRQGPKLGQVQGTVTLDGQPLKHAAVIFEPKAGGRASMAVTDASGHYELTYLRDAKGALIGPHRVKISTASEDDPKERVPARYNKQTTLGAEVTAGANQHNFKLTSR